MYIRGSLIDMAMECLTLQCGHTCMRRHGCTREFTSRLHRSITGIPIRGAITDVAILATAGNAAINSS